MNKILSFLMASTRKRRRRTVKMLIRMLALIRDAESNDMWRYSDLIDNFVSTDNFPCRKYIALEDLCLNSEFAFGALECAINDLNDAY